MSRPRQLWYTFRMTRSRVFRAAILSASLLIAAASLSLHAQNPAPTPPMGWNSWDAYGFTIDESDFKANVTVLAGLKQYGWTYAVIDEGWYMADPFGANVEKRKYLWDANGILIPVEARFPSSASGAGFKPLADWVHAQGLKFGIHIVRGIPRQVVKDNLPIAGSAYHAADAADLDSPCPWDEGNWGIKDNAAGQAYYDSMLKLYAAWGLDYIKVDCISDHPYRPTEIRQLAAAIRKTGRPIVLSLSPGPTQLDHATEVAKYAQMWRISDDHWDGWSFKHDSKSEFPFGIRDEFDRLAAWAPYVKPGAWPDADMLPEGSLTPHPGLGEPRQSRLTHDEQRTEFTLWAIARSPLIFGGNLTKLDDFSRALMTNKLLTYIDQHSVSNNPMLDLPASFQDIRVWTAITGMPENGPNLYYAFFNLGEKPTKLHVDWAELHHVGKHTATNVLDGGKSGPSETMDLTLPAHGSAVYLVE
jgi:alpha-galactosidase